MGCSACQEGFYKDNNACRKCDTSCATCSGAGTTSCETCKAGYYLKSDHSCIEESKCTGANYPDKQSGECKACSEITGCTACTYNDATGKPKCTNCNGKLIRTAADGTTACVEKTDDECKASDSGLFMKDDTTACILCNDTTTEQEEKNQGIVGCEKCSRTGPTPPTCSECLEGYKSSGSGSVTCEKCGANCATCFAATDETKCLTCKEGFFLAGSGEGRCISCETGSDSGYAGVPGCTACTTPASPGPASCSTCKIGYALQGATCVKTCEDETICGAIVVDSDGSMTYYCSQCRQQ